MMELSIMLVIAVLFCVTQIVSPKTQEEWKSRIIYQLLTDRFAQDAGGDPGCSYLRDWCGGNFKGIMQKLDYIEQLGANAIWISPIVLNTEDGYHGYWAKNLYEIEPHFGTREELHQLVQACHQRDIWVMVDVVANHMGYPTNAHGAEFPENEVGEDVLTEYTEFVPFNSADHYHTFCQITDYDNQTEVEICRLANLPDLNQTVPEVKRLLLEWIRDLTNEFHFDGYRVDTVRHVQIDFWDEFQASAGVFLLGEVWRESSSYVANYQTHMDSLVNFPQQYVLRTVFERQQSMRLLKTSLDEQRQIFRDVTVLGSFTDNHDISRFLFTKNDVSLLKNSVLYNIMGEGIPIIYYGTEQSFNGGDDPFNRETLWPYYDTQSDMFQFIKAVNDVRLEQNAAMNSFRQTELLVTDTAFVFERSAKQIIVALTNIGQGHRATIHVPGLEDMNGRFYVNIHNARDKIRVWNCQLKVQLNNGEPKVYVLTDDVDTCTICWDYCMFMIFAMCCRTK